MAIPPLLKAAKAKIENIGNNLADGIKESGALSSFEGAAKSVAARLDAQLSGIAQGIPVEATALTGITDPGATFTPDMLTVKTVESEPGPIGTFTDPKNFIPGETPAPFPNELEPFTSMSVIIELAVLTLDEIYDPINTYRKNGPENVILRSGGGLGESKVTTEYEKVLGTRLEYFIDDIEMDSIIAPNSRTTVTNATTMRFSVLEPYSMGMFLQTIHHAAEKIGLKSHLEATYLLTIKFKGFDENNNSQIAPYSTRMIPIRLTNVIFNVDASGSKYEVEAIAANDIAFDDNVQKVKTDIRITGRTVSELLQSGAESLSRVINDRQLELENKGQVSSADQIVIMFPKTKDVANPVQEENTGRQGATSNTDDAYDTQSSLDTFYQSVTGISDAVAPDSFSSYLRSVSNKVETRSRIGQAIKTFAESPTNINKIGTHKILESFDAPGHKPLGKPANAYDIESGTYKRDGVELQASQENRIFTFKRGTKIQEIIEEIVISSTYGKGLAGQLENIQENNGLVNWFRIEAQVFPIPDNKNIDRVGRIPKVYVYKVVPYKVHHSKFKAPTAPGVGYDKLKTEAAKEYNYIYTGANKDILDLEVQFNYQFFTPLSADRNSNSANDQLGAQNQSSNTDDAYTLVTGQGQSNFKPAEGVRQQQETIKNKTGRQGSAYDDQKTRIARDFHDSLMKGVDMIQVDMTIMGDPYYISDSGLGNYNAFDTSYTNINADGTMNYQNGEVDINLLFRTPIDYDGSVMAFPEDFGIVKPFSGLYQVILVKNLIRENQFTQELKLLRRPDQDNEAVETGVSALQSGTKAQDMNDNPRPKSDKGGFKFESLNLNDNDRGSPF